ncbi:MAG: glutamine synthetase type III, partial [Clostridia bacterium]|nr:glutamine synthetase type III [Clostridia bacterium]
GLSNYASTVDAIPHFADEKNVQLLEKHGVLSKNEVLSRTEILLEIYSKTVNIEALTMLEMAKKQILPSVLSYERKIVDMALNKKLLDENIDRSVETDLINSLSALTKNLYENIHKLESHTSKIDKGDNALEKARFYREYVFQDMTKLREICDKLEGLVDKNDWPFPTYSDLLYSIK